MPLNISRNPRLSNEVGQNTNYLGLNQERSGTALRSNVPAPTGGLNTRDSESAMEPTDAVIMENWFPDQGSVSTRKGYTVYATGLTSNVETLIEYNANTIRKFICANSSEINDVSTPASIVNLGTGFSNARWQWANFNAYVLMVNGADTPQTFDGTTLAASTISGSGLTVTQLDGINVHKNRVYVWSSNAQDVWYGATNAIGGTFTKFQLSRVAPFGGNLISMMTWNLDGGAGVDDYAVFLMSSGDVLLYQGSDPASWSLLGTYKIGRPIAIRGAKKVAGDIVMITDQDFVFFSEVFKNDGAVTQRGKLSGAAIKAVNAYASNYGWEVALYPKGGWLLLNVPVATNSTYHQYVINTITGAATKFTGMNARTWGLYNNNLYFGGDGKIYKADDGYDDNNEFIACDVQAAYSNLGSPQEKTINAFRNTLKADGTVSINSIVNFDYGKAQSTQNLSSTATGSFWDTSFWDVALWSPEGVTRNSLVYSSGQGVDVGMRLKTSLKGQQVQWYRTDYSVTVSNIL
jgi:hypothetical protein